MKKFNLLLAVCLISLLGSAQVVDWDQVIPANQEGEISYEDRLVQLAWQNYSTNRVFEIEVDAAGDAVKAAKLGWAEMFSLQFNINPRTINTLGEFAPPNDESNNFFPWYNVGIGVNPGTLISSRADRKAAEYEEQIAVQNLNTQKLAIRAEVLSRYHIYSHTLKTLQAVSENYETVNSTFILVREKFNNGESDFEEFNTAQSARTEALKGKLSLEMEYAIAKARLEELIGISVETVLY